LGRNRRKTAILEFCVVLSRNVLQLKTNRRIRETRTEVVREKGQANGKLRRKRLDIGFAVSAWEMPFQLRKLMGDVEKLHQLDIMWSRQGGSGGGNFGE